LHTLLRAQGTKAGELIWLKQPSADAMGGAAWAEAKLVSGPAPSDGRQTHHSTLTAHEPAP
jgi:hypothetical protein